MTIKGKYAILAWFQYISWTKGISPLEFNKCDAKDIKSIMAIHEAIGQKGMREQQISNMMRKMKW